jgi:hypothetical protein
MKLTLLGMIAILGVAAAVLMFLATTRTAGGSVVAEN